MDWVRQFASGLIEPVSDIIKEVVTDKDERNRLAAKIAETTATHAHNKVMGQIEINKVQAKHPSIFVSGARPFIMWVCGFGLIYHVMVFPTLDIWYEMPEQNTWLLVETLGGLLGLGTMRTAEKFRGVARENLRATP